VPTETDHAAAKRLESGLEAFLKFAEQYLAEHFAHLLDGKLILQSGLVEEGFVTRNSFIESSQHLDFDSYATSDLQRLVEAISKLYRMYGRQRTGVPLAIEIHGAANAKSSFVTFIFGIPD